MSWTQNATGNTNNVSKLQMFPRILSYHKKLGSR